MKIKIAALLAAILGVFGVCLFLIAFGTDYWLLVTEKCGGFEEENNNRSSEEDGKQIWKEGGKGILTFHHEGFFWRCWFFGEGYKETIWNFWFSCTCLDFPSVESQEKLLLQHTWMVLQIGPLQMRKPGRARQRASQAHPKHCMNAYLFPMPIVFGPHPHPSYDATAVYRGFWTALIVLAITASLVGVFLLVCGVPFVNARFYKVGGGFLMAAGCLFTLLIFMFVVWKEFAADLRKYILLERSERCPDDTPLSIYYGWSFMFATAGIPLALLSGLLFYLVGHSILKELE